jgi:hypothetical protein
MIFNMIDDKPIGEVPHEAMMEVMVDHCFFRFMDSGRSGLQSASRDCVHTFIARCVARKTIKANPAFDLVQRMSSELAKDLVNRFILSGTQGIYHALQASFTSVTNVEKPR